MQVISASHKANHSFLWRLHIDLPLLLFLFALIGFGFVVLYSASGQSDVLLKKQALRFAIGFAALFVAAQIPPRVYKQWIWPVFVAAIALLVLVLLVGDIGKGAQRWISVGPLRFQPAEFLKVILPILIAAFLSEQKPPLKLKTLLLAFALIGLPTILIAKQPDLGTAILVAASGFVVVFLAGLPLRILGGLTILGAMFLPLFWYFGMHDYQRTRVLTLLNPESDPLGAGYHIIQSKIAIGSGGIDGKGWLGGTQSQLEFLPERSTDFIFAVLAEEFGFIGVVTLFTLYACIILRVLYISTQCQDAFSRLAAGGLLTAFFIYIVVNVGMVSGLLPVVGVPLPLVSYGGTSIVSLCLSFGLLMSFYTHRQLHSK